MAVASARRVSTTREPARSSPTAACPPSVYAVVFTGRAKLVFTDFGETGGHSLAVMRFSIETHTASDHRVLYTTQNLSPAARVPARWATESSSPRVPPRTSPGERRAHSRRHGPLDGPLHHRWSDARPDAARAGDGVSISGRCRDVDHVSARRRGGPAPETTTRPSRPAPGHRLRLGALDSLRSYVKPGRPRGVGHRPLRLVGRHVPRRSSHPAFYLPGQGATSPNFRGPWPPWIPERKGRRKSQGWAGVASFTSMLDRSRRRRRRQSSAFCMFGTALFIASCRSAVRRRTLTPKRS